jgi:hypothetical protein
MLLLVGVPLWLAGPNVLFNTESFLAQNPTESMPESTAAELKGFERLVTINMNRPIAYYKSMAMAILTMNSYSRSVTTQSEYDFLKALRLPYPKAHDVRFLYLPTAGCIVDWSLLDTIVIKPEERISDSLLGSNTWGNELEKLFLSDSIAYLYSYRAVNFDTLLTFARHEIQSIIDMNMNRSTRDSFVVDDVRKEIVAHNYALAELIMRWVVPTTAEYLAILTGASVDRLLIPFQTGIRYRVALGIDSRHKWIMGSDIGVIDYELRTPSSARTGSDLLRVVSLDSLKSVYCKGISNLQEYLNGSLVVKSKECRDLEDVVGGIDKKKILPLKLKYISIEKLKKG